MVGVSAGGQPRIRAIKHAQQGHWSRYNPDDTGAIYTALAAHAAVRRLVSADDPRIAADVLVRSDGRRFAWLVSQANEPVTVQPQLAPGLRGGAARRAGADGVVTLPPFGRRPPGRGRHAGLAALPTVLTRR